MKSSKLLVATVLSLVALLMPTNMFAEKLVILATNDTHSQIDPDDMDNLGGILRRKVVIDSVKAANDNVLLIDAGDIVQGTLYFNLFKGKVEEDMMNKLGYDIRILGNHEFDNGIDSLAKNLAGANATLLSTNYDLSSTPLAGEFKPYMVKEIGGKRIGVIALNLLPKGMISAVNCPGVVYLDPVKAANAMAWYLRNIEKVDKVVAVSHIGYTDKKLANDTDLIGQTEGIDVVLGGHSHTLINPQTGEFASVLKNAVGEDVVVTQAGKSGKYVAEVTIDLDDATKMPEYKLIRIDSRLDDRIDKSLDDALAPYRARIEESMKKKVAKTVKELDRKSPDLLNFVADFVMARGKELAENVDLSIVNKGGIRRSLPKGDVTEGMIITMLPFSNRVQVVDLTGADLMGAFNQMATTDGNGISENVDITYDDNSGTCTSVLINGKPLDPEKTYRLASIDYLIEGGDYMETLTNSTPVASSENMLYDDLLYMLTKGKMKGKKINPSGKMRMHK